ncbi:hypothetical protein GSI_02663 [Ganoderma sinense ZZ0214-1]|uniref:Uncharacterized protein n=1 Tax=Ganoderma sinense ZZ0214-1 TaxID=1077348 RepID=A0A2G8SM77_9APHY|nr:hypothetical protein GSI_02663 [Ganoderma sinense ZZ0214-1]
MTWWCNVSSDILQNATLNALQCSQDQDGSCVALCPNPDISGVGVRSAFYIQSFMNTLLVIFSRRDSVPTTWAATLLTGALVIAAMVQKQTQSITLHHAILTLNFATLSCISSLAVAPTLSIWRLTPQQYYAKRLAHDMLDAGDESDTRHRMVTDAVEQITTGRHKRRVERAQNRQRIFLAFALLIQVVLQWAWGVVLFVSPVYSQANCSGDTALIFFLYRFTAREINDRYMYVWVLWLLFSLGITMAMTVVLAVTSPARARAFTQHSSPVSTMGTRSLTMSTSSSSTPRPVHRQVYESVLSAVPPFRDTPRQLVFWYNVLCVILWLVYIIASEIQIQANCLFTGENSITSFGQITALLLSLAPLWSLSVALYRWPQTRRRLERRRRRVALSNSLVLTRTQTATGSVTDLIVPNLDFASVADPDAGDGKGTEKGTEKGEATVEHIETTRTTALPAGERARPTRALQSAMRGGRARSRSQDPQPQSQSRSRSRGPRGAGARSRASHVRAPTGSFLDAVPVPTSTAEEWNELATFGRSS